MKEAQQKLEKARREDSIKDQQAAQDELNLAKKELEKILRQLREQEIERVLRMLEGRFRDMLVIQLRIYEDTLKIRKIPAAERARIGNIDIRAHQLSVDEKQLSVEATKALTLLREEGSSVAFPETVEQMVGDMDQVAARLDGIKFDTITTGLEEDIIRTLQEMIEALVKAQKEQEKRKSDPPPPPPPGQPQDQPLVDKIAELKMIRSLQIRINQRTERYSRLLESEGDELGQATEAGLVEAIRKLAEKEASIHKITRDVMLEKNK